MQLGTSFTGIAGIPNQDIAMWETMGPIADRSHDRLGASDLAIVEFRRQMVQAAKTMQQDGKAIGAEEPRIPHYKLKSFQGIVPKEEDWRQLGTAPEEVELYESLQ